MMLCLKAIFVTWNECGRIKKYETIQRYNIPGVWMKGNPPTKNSQPIGKNLGDDFRISMVVELINFVKGRQRRHAWLHVLSTLEQTPYPII